MKRNMFAERHYVVLTRLLAHNCNLQGFIEDLIHTLKADNQRFNETIFRQHLRKDE